MVVNQSTRGLNRGLSPNVWRLKNVNYVKFTAECVIFAEKHVLVKKMFTNGPNVDLPLRA